MKRKLLIINFFFLFFSYAFADTKIINPESGIWANKQLLVLDISEYENAYYSLNGTDPLLSGFAYDGPVLLDMTGEVQLRVVSIAADGTLSETDVFYTVVQKQPAVSISTSFSNDMILQGIVEYRAGEQFSISSDFLYSFGKLPESFRRGELVSYSPQCILARYVPCTVTDGHSKWRLIIKTMPSLSGSVSMRYVPFKIYDWETIAFTDAKLIYRIDASYWSAIKAPVQLDRSIPHTISWQSIEVARGNPITSFELPPKPKITIPLFDDGSRSVCIDGNDGYQIGIASESGVMLFDAAVVDTFPGDEVAGVLHAGIYYNSIYQGMVSVPYEVDKRAPAAPVIHSTAQSFYSRRPVEVTIDGDDDALLFVAISEPVAIHEDAASSEARVLFDAVALDDFVQADSRHILLDSHSAAAVYYRLCAYLVDRSGNESERVLYDVVIDKYNYYIDATADPSIADGSSGKPFASFESCLDAMQENRFAHITVIGAVAMPRGETALLFNCILDGQSNAELVFLPGSSLVVRSASLEVNNCIIRRTDSDTVAAAAHSSLIKLEHSVLTLNNCEVAISFMRNGTIVNADASAIAIADSGLTAISQNYASCIAAVNTKIKVTNSRISSVSQTAVNFSMQGGELELRSSFCRVSCSYGRNVELFGAQGRIVDNIFDADLKSSTKISNAIYTDEKNILLEYAGNTMQGY